LCDAESAFGLGLVEVEGAHTVPCPLERRGDVMQTLDRLVSSSWTSAGSLHSSGALEQKMYIT